MTAKADPPPLPAVRPRSDLDDLARLGQWLAWSESGKNDERSRGAAAALRLYYARELGLTPLAAADLAVINGRLVVGAALLRALARRAGYKVERLASTDESCTARIVDRQTGDSGESTFTIDDAQRAGLIRDKSAWTTHPARMLWARASKNAIVDFAPEVALGITLDDELREIAPPTSSVMPGDGVVDQDPELLALRERAERLDLEDDPVTDDDDDDDGVDVDDIEF